jgi:hypothetical protein
MIHPTAETRAPIAEALFRGLEQAGFLPPAREAATPSPAS